MKKLLQMKFMLLLCALIVGSGTMWADTKTEGFETKAAATTYNSTVTINATESDCGISWQIYYGTVSTNDKISGTKSAHMRWYSSATSNYPYIMTTTPVDGLSKVSLKARTSSTDVKMDLSYSADGTTWTVGKTYTFTKTGVGEAVSLDIPSGNKYVKFGVNSSSTAPGSSYYKLIVDDVEFTYSTGPSISASDASVLWNDEGGNIEYTISNPLNPEWEQVMMTTDSGDNWLQSGGYGNNGKLPFTVSTNYGDERSATVTLTYSYKLDSDNTVYQVNTTATVTQTAKPAPVITVEQDSYTMGKDETSIQIPYSIENANPSISLTVAIEGGANWPGLTTDLGNGIITITTAANSGPERTVNVVLGYPGAENKTVTLTQEGVIWPTVSFRANPAEGASVLNCTSNSNQLTSGSMVEPGSWVTLYVGLADNYEFDSWTDANDKLDFSNTTTTPGTDPKSVTLVFQMPEDDVEIVANLKSNLSEEWVETTLANLTENDVFVIVGDNGSTYAMANDGGTTSAPSAVAVTVANGKLTGSVADNIQWNISGDDTNGYTFYPNGSTTTWLYCTSTNNGVRVGGTNDNKTFVISNDYLYHNGTSRYVGIYQSQDWRCYTSINANIKDQTFAFYKKVSTAPDERAEAGLAFAESSYSVELFNAASFTSPVLTNPNELSPITWTSSNETVATVNEGTVTILSEGETTIKASFDGDENYKKGEASYTLTVVDNRQTATVTWKDADGNNITELNVDKGDFIQGITLSCNVEGFTFTEEHLQHLWGTNETHDNYAGQQPAGYIFTPNAVWTAALGITTITATFPGNETHKPASATLTVTVTGGTEKTPYTVAEARAAIDAGTGVTEVYATGIVSEIVTAFNSQYGNITYNISADGLTTSDQLQAYRGKSYNGDAFTSADDIQVGDVVVVKGNLINYQGTYEFAQGNQLVSLVRKPAAPTFDPEAGSYTSVQNVTISTTTAGATIYYTTDGTSPTTESNLYSEPIEVNTDMTIKAIAVKDSEISTVATAEYVINLTPSIVFDGEQNPANVTYTAGETNIHYVASNVADLPTIVICDSEGNQANYDWFSAVVTNDAYVHVTWQANTDTENSRTAYFKLTSGATESEIFEFTQAKYVPDYATLPFEFDGGLNDIKSTSGLTQNGLGSDYASSPKLKFDNPGDYLVLKIDEAPGKLTFDIEGNSFSGGTFKVQTSADGETFTDLASYKYLGNTRSEEFDDLDADVRYIKWIYTSKSSGNVGLGNIKLEKLSTDPVIKLAETSVEVDAKQHDGTIALTYKNLQIDDMEDFSVQFFSDEQGTVTTDAPEWVEALVAEQDPNVGPGYVLSYVINANDGAERTAYLRVYADDGVNSVASDVVTITQKAPQTTYRKVTSTVGITSGKYLIVYEEESKVFNGSLGTLDAANNCQEVFINDNEIKTNEAIYFNIDVNAGTLQSASGKYIGVDSNSNGLSQSEESKTYTNSFSIDGDGNAVIAAVFTGSTMTLRFNSNTNQNRFRYFKNNQKAIQLYKEVTDEEKMAIPIAAACTDGTNCFGTFSSTKPFVVPENLTVSEIGINTDGTMNVVNYDAGAVVPANTGVMVSAQEGRTYAVSVATAEEAASATSVLGVNNRLRPTGDNGLTATEMTSAEPETCKFYRLTMHNGTTIGFWWGADGGDSFAIVANKAYLAVPASVAGARNGFAFGDDATGINNVNFDLNDNDNCYDLQGRKVSKPGKGLYIVNGKKVVIK